MVISTVSERVSGVARDEVSVEAYRPHSALGSLARPHARPALAWRGLRPAPAATRQSQLRTCRAIGLAAELATRVRAMRPACRVVQI